MSRTPIMTVSELARCRRFAIPIQTAVVIGSAFNAVGISCSVVRIHESGTKGASDDDLQWSLGMENVLSPAAVSAWNSYLQDMSYQAASDGRPVGSGIFLPRSLPVGECEVQEILQEQAIGAWIRHADRLVFFLWVGARHNAMGSLQFGPVLDLFYQAEPSIRTWVRSQLGEVAYGQAERSSWRRGLLSLSPTEQRVFYLFDVGDD